MAETAGSVTGDGVRGTRPGKDGTYCVIPQPDGGWVVEKGKSGQISSVHRKKDEAVDDARGRAREHEPSQVLVYKKDGTVQAEHTCG